MAADDTKDPRNSRNPAPRSRGGQSDQSERRAQRRLKISEGSAWIETFPKYGVVDISPSGIGLTADHPVRTGELIRISLRGGPSADALVISCRLGKPPKQLLGLQFRVGCRFTAAREGGRLLDEIEYQLASMMD